MARIHLEACGGSRRHCRFGDGPYGLPAGTATSAGAARSASAGCCGRRRIGLRRVRSGRGCWTFKPVCPASDGLYGLGKAFADGLLGAEGAEYRPLAIEALLRVRLEVCVLESFVYEAIIPFVERKGIGWVLPLHETIDTVIAGTVFAVALNFIDRKSVV